MLMRVTETLTIAAAAALVATASLAAPAPGSRTSDHEAIAPHTVNNVLPPARCKLKGTWTGDYGTVTMKSNKKGIYTLSYCSQPEKLQITNFTKAGFHVIASYAGTDCTGFTEDLTFQGSCDVASGTFTNPDGGSGPEQWNRQ
jgi:hypothetical protein